MLTYKAGRFQGHSSITKLSKGVGKGGLVLIFWCNTNMEITKKIIQEKKVMYLTC